MLKIRHMPVISIGTILIGVRKGLTSFSDLGLATLVIPPAGLSLTNKCRSVASTHLDNHSTHPFFFRCRCQTSDLLNEIRVLLKGCRFTFGFNDTASAMYSSRSAGRDDPANSSSETMEMTRVARCIAVAASEATTETFRPVSRYRSDVLVAQSTLLHQNTSRVLSQLKSE
jgi:hypothetical protein